MNIQEVYNNISDEFSHTRHSVWNAVKEFLQGLPSQSLLGDIGCGNGKNMLYRPDLICQGIDYSDKLVGICKQRGLDVLCGSILNIPFRDSCLDNTICIAVIHHLRLHEERICAIRELVRVTRPGGKILISVWALQQDEDSKRKFATNDVLVPFMVRGSGGCNSNEVYKRFYHVYGNQELENDLTYINEYDFSVERIFYEKGNWYAILSKNEY
jgi:SAM-dependent methyltransferase